MYGTQVFIQITNLVEKKVIEAIHLMREGKEKKDDFRSKDSSLGTRGMWMYYVCSNMRYNEREDIKKTNSQAEQGIKIRGWQQPRARGK